MGLQTVFCFKPYRQILWFHTKTKHAIHAAVYPMPCLFSNCLHFASCDQRLKCDHCGVLCLTVKSYLIHLRVHVRRNECVTCPVKHCNFCTNILGTFGSHMSKKHGLLTVQSIKDTSRHAVVSWHGLSWLCHSCRQWQADCCVSAAAVEHLHSVSLMQPVEVVLRNYSYSTSTTYCDNFSPPGKRQNRCK